MNCFSCEHIDCSVDGFHCKVIGDVPWPIAASLFLRLLDAYYGRDCRRSVVCANYKELKKN